MSHGALVLAQCGHSLSLAGPGWESLIDYTSTLNGHVLYMAILAQGVITTLVYTFKTYPPTPMSRLDYAYYLLGRGV